MARPAPGAGARLGRRLLAAGTALALLIGAWTLALPQLGGLREPVARWLSATLGQEVALGRLELRGRGLAVRLILHDLALRDPESGRSRLHIGELAIDLDGPASLLAGAPRITQITLTRADLTLRRRADGTLTIAGLERLAHERRGAKIHFLAHGRLRLRDTELAWPEAPTPALRRLSAVSLGLINRRGQHRLVLAARAAQNAAAPPARIELSADLAGPADAPGHWDGQVYLIADGIDLGGLLADRLPLGAAPAGGRLAVAGRVDWVQGAPAQALGRLALSGLVPPGATAPIEQATAWLRWRPHQDGWELEIPSLTQTQGQQVSGGTGIQFQARGRQLTGSLRTLDLPVLAPALAALGAGLPREGPWTQLAAELAGAGLRGRVEDLSWRLALPAEVGEPLPTWQARARLIGIASTPSGRLPGIAGLNALLVGGSEGGSIALIGKDARLELPGLFRAPLALTGLAGELGWTRDPTGHLTLRVPRLLAETRDIKTLSHLTLEIPPTGEGTRLALYSHFREGEAAAVPRYLPVGIMPAKVVDWLDHAFPAGRIPSGDLVFEGPVAAFPFDQGEGRFAVLFDVADLELDYHPDWPPLMHADGRLRFLGRGLEIELAHARMLDTDLGPVAATIADLGRAERVLIRGQGTGPFADGLRLVRETPLAGRHSWVAETLAATGRFQLNLGLAVPIGDEAPVRLHGEITWPKGQAAVAIAGSPLVIDKLSGRLIVTADGLHADAVRGTLWDEPVTLRIDPRAVGRGSDTTARIRLAGTTAIAELTRHYPSGLWSAMAGRLPWALDLRLRLPVSAMRPDRLTWRLTSDLVGLGLELPPPFAKAKGQARPFTLSGDGDPRSSEHPIEARLGQVVARFAPLRTANAGKPALRAAIDLDGQPGPLPEGPGLAIRGAMQRFDLADWLAWWRRRAEALDGDRDGDLGRLGAAPPLLRELDLKAERVTFGELALEGVGVRAERRARGWEARVTAAELAGALTLPAGPASEPLQLSLERLDVAALLANREARAPHGRRAASGPTRSTPRLDPAWQRPILLDIVELSWNGHPLGRLSARSRALPEGLVFDPISLAGPLAKLVGTGRWGSGAAGTPRSELSLDGKIADLGVLLDGLGYPSVLDRAPTDATLTLAWPGGPADLDPATIAGRLRFAIGPGHLPEVEPGLGRMLGILNLAALQRRLALDFSDLYGRGLGFEQIDGDLAIGSGEARIERFEILGPSGDIAISGRTDLVARRLDQVVTITPKVSSSVALASAVAGGPLVGAAVYVADQVAGGAVDRLSRYQYRVTGPWSNPTFTRRDRFSGLSATAGSGETVSSRPPTERPTNHFLDVP